MVRQNPLRTALVALAVGVASVACGGDGDDPDTAGAQDQAVEQLRDFGLTGDQASCIVDRIGPETVNEAADLNALTESQQYQQAAADCTR